MTDDERRAELRRRGWHLTFNMGWVGPRGGFYKEPEAFAWLDTELRVERDRRAAMTFRVIDLETGKEADLKIISGEPWIHEHLIFTRPSKLSFAVSDDNGALALLDSCGNCVWCPSGRFRVEMVGS